MIARGLWLILACLFFSACAHEENESDNREQVSTIPWNKPERWEGQGAFGGINPDQRNY